jgi:hypothetical protein
MLRYTYIACLVIAHRIENKTRSLSFLEQSKFGDGAFANLKLKSAVGYL